jgi:outer membrane murein-binding lipoprotein Lpp
MTILATALGALLAGMIVGAAIQRLTSDLQSLQMRIAALEAAAKTRNPYRTNDGLEDAMAIVHDAVWQADATLDYVRARMRQVDQTLKTIRSEPNSYDSERPNQKIARGG